jgi:predicted nuclease of predicted toxin-antitoxin system
LPPNLGNLLVAAGYDDVHVQDLRNACSSRRDDPGEDAKERRTVVSADTDFGQIVAVQRRSPSFILFREPNLLSARDYFEMLVPNFANA